MSEAAGQDAKVRRRAEVVVVGGGPVGLSAAIALGRLGTSVVVAERAPAVGRHPKAHWENARTMEIFRQWGIEQEVREDALPGSWLNGALFVTRLDGHELGAIRWDEDPGYLARTAALGPAPSNSAPQDRVEPVLLRAAQRLGGVDVLLEREAVDVRQSADGAEVVVRSADGALTTIACDYVVGCDGSRSRVREACGIGVQGPGALGTQLGVYFHADLAPYLGDRHYLLYWIYSPDVQGVLISLDGRQRWHFLFPYDAEVESPEDYGGERCRRLIAEGVVGDASCAVDVRSVLPWRMQSSIAERFRAGRVFLAGDAAHSMPPTGGLGLNTGVADVHNLAWKLALVLHHGADPALLDTYEQERRPVAEFNSSYSLTNAVKMAETGLSGILVRDPDAAARLDAPDGAPLRAALSAAIPEQREQFYFDGVTLGYTYESGAVVADGTPPEPSTISEYRPSARPGARAPHVWLVDGAGRQVSSTELPDGRFVLLGGAAAGPWVAAAGQVARLAGLPLDAYRVLPGTATPAPGALADPAGVWAQTYGVGPAGAVVLRPDGHVGWRSADAPGEDAAAELASALATLAGAAAAMERR